MPKRQLRLLFVVGLCVSLFTSSQLPPGVRAATPTFTDVDPNATSPYAVAIYALAQQGIFNGYNDGTGRFGPLDPIVRAQVAAVVVRALGWSGNQGRSNFSDQGTVDNELWNSVRILADRGVAKGFGDGTYRPTLPVAQVQVISLITRAMVNAQYWVNQTDAGTLYPDVPASSGARTDIVTYTFYVGNIPFATSTGAGGWTSWATPAQRQEVALVVWNALQANKNKPPQPPTPTPMPNMVGVCGESTMTWHPPVVNGCATGHEHGDAPPAWVTSSRWQPMFDHPGNTPNENVLKHSSFKGFSFRANGVDLYVIAHLDTNPSGHTSRFHSVQVWVRDGTGAVSHWDFWMDFGSGNETGPHIEPVEPCGNDGARPIMMVNFTNCGQTAFENWYSRPGAISWGWDFGFNISPNYYAGTDPQHLSSGNLADMATWLPTGELNTTRRIELAYYGGGPRGDFWATQFGQVVSGPTAPVCGTTRVIGGKSYTVLCIAQYIAPTMPVFKFPGNSVQKNYSTTGVHLPN